MGTDTTLKIGLLTASISRNAGGLFVSVRKLAQTLQTIEGLQIQVLGMHDPYSVQDLPKWGDIRPHLFATHGPIAFSFAPKMAKFLYQSELDLVHTQGLWMYPSVAVHYWSRFSNKPYLVTPRGMLDPWAVRNARWKKCIAGWLYENTHLRDAACIHALCKSEADAIRAYGLRNPICIIPNGIDPPVETLSTPPLWRSAIPNDAKILLYLGRLHPKKGLLNLLNAWSLLACPTSLLNNNWHLVIAGWDQGGHKNELKVQAQQLGLQTCIHFVGPQFDAAKHASYRHANAFILPSFSEGLPMTVLEAWSYGLPVLMTPQCNLPEGFQSQAALRISQEPEHIVQGISTLFAMTDQQRMAMGKRGQALVAQRFNWPHIAQQMLSVYRWVLRQGDKPDCVTTDHN